MTPTEIQYAATREEHAATLEEHTATRETHAAKLTQLEQRLADELALLELPAHPWLAADGTHADNTDYDVIVIGAGLCGLTAAAALVLAGVTRILCLDKAPVGQEGPWITSARMTDLRTRKTAAGPALGIPALTFRAWYEAQYGAEAYQAMVRIPRQLWMDYLVWYRRVLSLPVRNQVQVTRVQPGQNGIVDIDADTPQGPLHLRARRVVLATGIDGLGAPALPDLARELPAHTLAHSADLITPSQVAGKRVAVIGSGASAMDNAAFALENGATQVEIFYRRPTLPRIDKFTGIGHQGLTIGYVALPDETKWQLMLAGEQAQIPPPRHSVQRVARHDNVTFHNHSPLLALEHSGNTVIVRTPHGHYHVDFIIFATGFQVDFAARPEFSSFAQQVCQWSDRYTPPAGADHTRLASSPYLGDHFELLAKPDQVQHSQALSNIYCFAFPAVLSHGKLTSGIPAIAEGAQRLTRGIISSLLIEDRAALLARFHAYDTPELLGDEWQETSAPCAIQPA